FTAARIEPEWRALTFTAPPDAGRAIEQYDAFVELVAASGARVEDCRDAAGLTLDAIYVRDASIVTPKGLVLCHMGKPARQGEPAAQGRAYGALGLPVIGAIDAPGLLEGGDVVWFDDRRVAVGRGYRTNDDGIRQLRRLLGDGVEVVVVPLPHHRGPGDVFHLMSILSPVDEDLAVVYSPLLPVPFRQWLLARGLRLVEVPDEELESIGVNVLAIAPRRCVMLDGNPRTRARLEAAGAQVAVYDGSEISLKGGGGPTCLTRPLDRE
ncbi:MAG: dimethylarginine dimethylaminohydrolase family protein, partial [Gammaproteobacteria bacterium]